MSGVLRRFERLTNSEQRHYVGRVKAGVSDMPAAADWDAMCALVEQAKHEQEELHGERSRGTMPGLTRRERLAYEARVRAGIAGRREPQGFRQWGEPRRLPQQSTPTPGESIWT